MWGCRFWTGLLFGGLLCLLLLWAAVYRLATVPPHFEQFIHYAPPLSSSDTFASPPPPPEDGEERYALLAVFDYPSSDAPPSPSTWDDTSHLLHQAESFALKSVLGFALTKQRQNSQAVQHVERERRQENGDDDRAGEQRGRGDHGLFSSFSLAKHVLDRNAANPDNKNASGGGHDDDASFTVDDLDEQLPVNIVAFQYGLHPLLLHTVSLDIEAGPDGGRWLAAHGFLLPPRDARDGVGDGLRGSFNSSKDDVMSSLSFMRCSSLAEAQRLAWQLQKFYLPSVWAEFLGDDGDGGDYFREDFSGNDGDADLDLNAALPWRKGSVLRAVRWDPEWGGIRAQDEQGEDPQRHRKQEETAAVVRRYRWKAFPFSHFQDLFRYIPNRFEAIGLLSQVSPRPRVAHEHLKVWDHFRCIVSGFDNGWEWGWNAIPSGTTDLTYALSSPRDGRIQRLREELLLPKAAETAAEGKRLDEELRAGHKEPRVHAASRQFTVEQSTNATTTRQQHTQTGRQGVQTDEL